MAEMKVKPVLHEGNVIRPDGLRRENAPYLTVWVLYYAWVIAFATWWTASPLSDSAFKTDIRSLMHIVNILSSAVFVLIIRQEWYVKTARAGALLIIMSMIAFYALPGAQLKTLAAVTGAVAIGCVNISILIPFVFALNNTEKLYAVVFSNVLIQLISLVKEHGLSELAEPALSILLLILALSSVLFFRSEVRGDKNSGEGCEKLEMHPRIYLSLVFNCAIAILCKGAGKGILNIAAEAALYPVLTWYYIGGLVGCMIYVLVYAFTKKAYIWLGNITFSGVAIGMLCNAFIPEAPVLALPFAILLGLGSTIGMINMYYIIGVIGKKYDSMRYIRRSIVFIGICGGVSGVAVGNIIDHSGTFGISVFASIFSAVVMISFMFVSPVMERAEYVNDWGRDSAKTEVGEGRLGMFRQYGLTKREIEVCELLLQGYTLRQISAILPIAYSTVNTYCTSAYRKLEINSRTELLLKFKDLINE